MRELFSVIYDYPSISIISAMFILLVLDKIGEIVTTKVKK